MMGVHDPIKPSEYYEALSIDSVFGGEKSLSVIVDKLRRSEVDFYYKLGNLTEDEFWKVIGRTTSSNRQKISQILEVFPPKFAAKSTRLN